MTTETRRRTAECDLYAYHSKGGGCVYCYPEMFGVATHLMAERQRLRILRVLDSSRWDERRKAELVLLLRQGKTLPEWAQGI